MRLEPIVVRACEGSFWRTPKADAWSWLVVVLDQDGNLVSDCEAASAFFGAERVEALIRAGQAPEGGNSVDNPG
jgi:hypothetical protein